MTSSAPAGTRGLRLPPWALGLLGIVGIILVWWIWALLTPMRGSYAPVPTPLAVLQQVVADGPGYYWPSFRVTLTEAGIGYLWGNVVALVLCAVALVVPRFEGVLNQVAVISYCLPIVAIGPLLVLILGGADDRGDTSTTATFFAGLSVFFTTVVGTLLGLKAADRAALDVVTVYGGSRFTQLRKVRVIAALPNVMSALQIAVPAAFLGAILGEYFGKIDQAVGRLMVANQVALDSPRVWALFILCALVSLVGYGLLGLVARLVAPWSSGRNA
jgi:ABC-type nitrate/sulfonate/bicarbonate transport system permease component